MPGIINEYLAHESLASEPWSEAILYQPYETEQILLAENASCLAVKTYLKMCNLPYTVNPCANAEFMSPGGRMTKLPFLCVGAFVASEFEPIVNLVENKGISLTTELDAEQKSEIRAYLSLVENIFTNAELYISFLDKEVLEKVTYPRNGSVFPWPLNHIQNWRKRRSVLNQLFVFGWRDIDMDTLIEKVEHCCTTLSIKLGENIYFVGDNATELDAAIFGHLFAILTTELPNSKLAQTVHKFPSLVNFCKNIDKRYFPHQGKI